MKIAYLTWGETPRTAGVFGSQAIGQFLANSDAMPQSKFFFISAIPIIHSGLIRERTNYSEEIKKITKRLGRIPFYSLPIYAPQNFIFSSKSTFGLMHFGTSAKLRSLFRKIDPDVVHCRSYHAAYAALMARRKFGFKYKVVFDPRGIWSEEVALRKGFSEINPNYHFLKEIESWIVGSSDAVVSVSPQMKSYFDALGALNSTCIYLSAPVEKIKKLRRSNANKGCAQDLSIIYLGTLGSGTWHRPSELISLYKHLQKIIDGVDLKIVTMSNHTAIREEFRQAGCNDVQLFSASSLEQLVEYLDSSSLGILSYFNPKSRNERILSNVVMAVKTAEYLAAGLPILVNKTCGGAAGVVHDNNVGIAYDPDSFEEINESALRGLLTSEVSERATALAGDLFDYRANANRYQQIYQNLQRPELAPKEAR
ncbi:glycosyltransferase [Variovorax paradoxus]|uniref:glycosyltransferase n=1 Tax=Variovorax paradoxus TaxID=34073 RepID=UPI003ED053A6